MLLLYGGPGILGSEKLSLIRILPLKKYLQIHKFKIWGRVRKLLSCDSDKNKNFKHYFVGNLNFLFSTICNPYLIVQLDYLHVLSLSQKWKFGRKPTAE